MKKDSAVATLTVILSLIVAWSSLGDPWIPIGQPGDSEGIVDFVVEHETIYAIAYFYPTNNVCIKENCFDEQSQWQIITNNIELYPGEHLVSINVAVNPYHPDSATIFVGTNLGSPSRLWKSCNKGSTWAISHEQSFFTYSRVVIDPRDWRKIWAATWPGLIVSEDGGGNWIPANPPDSQYISSICFDPADSLTVYVSTVGFQPHYGTVFKTTDGGQNWQDKSSGLPESIDWTVMVADPNVSGILCLVPTFFEPPPWGDDLSIYKTTNGGDLWERQTVAEGNPHPTFRCASLMVNPYYPKIVYLGSWFPAGRLYQSCDRGSTWMLISDEATGKIVVDKEEPEKVYVVFEDGIWCYEDPQVSVEEDSDPDLQLPDRCTLLQNYPNPFNAQTVISYQVPQESQVSLRVYNLLGQEVTTLVDGEKVAGSYRVCWKGEDARGQEVTSGIYFCRLQVVGYAETRKMILLR